MGEGVRLKLLNSGNRIPVTGPKRQKDNNDYLCVRYNSGIKPTDRE